MENPESPHQSKPPEAEKNLSPVSDGREHCPRYGRLLEPHKCKLVCECGYFMSCSDF